MRRYGEVLILKPGMEARYEAYHRRVWPSVVRAALKAGIRNYSIYRYRRWLFAYFELPASITLEHAGRILENQAVCRRWEKIMHRMQARLPESCAGNWWVPMKQVFHACGDEGRGKINNDNILNNKLRKRMRGLIWGKK